jgi:hypothetical protein
MYSVFLQNVMKLCRRSFWTVHEEDRTSNRVKGEIEGHGEVVKLHFRRKSALGYSENKHKNV